MQEREDLLLWYAVAYLGLVAVIGLLTFLMRKSHELHVHHYLIGMLLLPLPRFFNPMSSTTQAIAAGVFVEGLEATLSALYPLSVIYRYQSLSLSISL